MSDWKSRAQTVEANNSWRDRAQVENSDKSKKPGEAALQGFGQAGSFGYLPQLQAAASPLMTGLLNIPRRLKGEEPVQDDSTYAEREKEFESRDQGLLKENPELYAAGAVGGALATPVPGLGGAKLLSKLPKVGKALEGSKIAKGVIGAAEQGALYNPGEDGSRVENALEAGATAGKLGLLGKVAQVPGKLLTTGSSKLPTNGWEQLKAGPKLNLGSDSKLAQKTKDVLSKIDINQLTKYYGAATASGIVTAVATGNMSLGEAAKLAAGNAAILGATKAAPYVKSGLVKSSNAIEKGYGLLPQVTRTLKANE